MDHHDERRRSEVLDAFGEHLIEAASAIGLQDLTPEEEGRRLRLDISVAIDADSLAQIAGEAYAAELLGKDGPAPTN